MTITIDFVFILQGVTVLLIGAGVRGLFKISDHLSLLNGQVGKMKIWQEEHQRLDEAEFSALRRELDKVAKKAT